jgi:hypothetical protein
MRHDHLVTVHATVFRSQAEALKDLLRASGIPCILGAIIRARIPGVPVVDIQIQVPPAFVPGARQQIDRQDGAPGPSRSLGPSPPRTGKGRESSPRRLRC